MTEYIHHLQKRNKWQHPQRNLSIGDLVLLKEPSAPAKKWKLARITKTYLDPEGLVHKADVKTATREEVQRGVNTMVPLHMERAANYQQEHL